MTIVDKKIIAKRILALADNAGMNLKSFATEIDFSYSNLQKYAAAISAPSASLYLALFEYGVDLNWFASGEGEMFRASKRALDTSAAINYQGNNVAVHNNHGSVSTGLQQSEVGGRGAQICAWINDYMENADPDEQAWLEVEMSRQFPEYKKWKKGKS